MVTMWEPRSVYKELFATFRFTPTERFNLHLLFCLFLGAKPFRGSSRRVFILRSANRPWHSFHLNRFPIELKMKYDFAVLRYMHIELWLVIGITRK